MCPDPQEIGQVELKRRPSSDLPLGVAWQTLARATVPLPPDSGMRVFHKDLRKTHIDGDLGGHDVSRASAISMPRMPEAALTARRLVQLVDLTHLRRGHGEDQHLGDPHAALDRERRAAE